MNFKERFIKYWKVNLIVFGVSLVIGTGLFLLMYFVRGQNIISACDGLGLAGGVLVCCGVLAWVIKEGFFDLLGYGIKQMGHFMFTRNNPTKYNDYAGYKEQQNTKRTTSADTWIPIIVAGALFLLAFIPVDIIAINMR